ncbi:MAG: hypothetical protein IKE46_08870 [Selenomonadaceae bacterium]|nr:hypothetical protein [Selenomonadaceae bacterium]
MPTGRILDLAAKSPEIYENDMPAALIYFGERAPVNDWQELFFVAIKCLYLEFPDTISSLCSTDSTRTLFLRTNTIAMKRPKKIAPIIYLETDRTPQQIVKAIKIVFSRANIHRINMQIEVYSPEVYSPPVVEYQQENFYPQENVYSPPPVEQRNFYTLPAENYPAPKRPRNQKPVLHLNQTIEEMLATLDEMETAMPQKNSRVVLPHAAPVGKREPQIFGNLFFMLEGMRHGPFDNEKSRYVALMQCLAELYPYQILKEAGHHINSMHRLTLMKGGSYLYFREPVELPNNMFLDKDFPDRVLVENERYFLERCGLYFENVMFSA